MKGRVAFVLWMKVVRFGSKGREIEAKDAKPDGTAVDNGAMAKENSIGRRDAGEKQEA